MLQRVDTSGPVAVEGLTLNLVARSHARTFGPAGAHLFHLRARPTHVEVLGRDGSRRVLRIPDLERTALLVILGTTLACVAGTRVRRRR